MRTTCEIHPFLPKKNLGIQKNRDVVTVLTTCSQILVFLARSRGTLKKAMQLCSLTFLLWPGWKQNWICTEKSGCSYSNNYMQLDFGLFGLSQRHIQKCHVVAQFAFSFLARAKKIGYVQKNRDVVRVITTCSQILVFLA